ncbi:DUF4232 domain-containing protein [Streptomyces sp. NPDC093085]|uniref:DUF4232 domain-containing protein n=1 Tax=Streptomyces sp. NPDC093085 TaxID=3155068 RepID=UPI0034434069
MRVHKLTFAALAVAASLSLTACQNDDNAMAENDKATAAAEASTGGSGSSGSGSSGSGSSGSGSSGSDASGSDKGGATGSGSGSADKGGASGSGGGGGLAKCRTDDLKITAIDSTIDGDEGPSVAIGLKNISGKDCSISGYAGVDLKTNSGNISAERTSREAVVNNATLKNGREVGIALSYPANDTGGSGIRITGLVVTPPDETKSVTIAWPGQPSLPVTDGSSNGGGVQVGPVGSAGQGGEQ